MEEYKKAKGWLDRVYAESGLSMNSTYVVPGNHDVDRKFIAPNFPLWQSHRQIRDSVDPTVWEAVLETLIYKDPARLLLSPLNAFNSFAQGCGCATSAEQLAWCRVFEKPFADGSRVRLHGLNSAIVSDEADWPGKLLVSRLQTSHFEETPGLVDVVMCHHPPDWLMGADKGHVRDALRAFAPVALFGHEHSFRIQEDSSQVQLFAGAVQPSRRDRDWLPTYHILQLNTEESERGRELVVRVHTREFDNQNFRFRAHRDRHDNETFEHRLPLPPWAPPTPVGAMIELAQPALLRVEVGSEMSDPSASTGPSVKESAQRQLMVSFFELPTPLRYASAFQAGLLREGDDALHPQVMWSEVFRRAMVEELLATFWNAVAAHSPELRSQPNPFASVTDA